MQQGSENYDPEEDLTDELGNSSSAATDELGSSSSTVRSRHSSNSQEKRRTRRMTEQMFTDQELQVTSACQKSCCLTGAAASSIKALWQIDVYCVAVQKFWSFTSKRPLFKQSAEVAKCAGDEIQMDVGGCRQAEIAVDCCPNQGTRIWGPIAAEDQESRR